VLLSQKPPEKMVDIHQHTHRHNARQSLVVLLLCRQLHKMLKFP